MFVWANTNFLRYFGHYRIYDKSLVKMWMLTYMYQAVIEVSILQLFIIYTHYHNSNLIWRTVSRRVDEVIPSDHPRRVASRVIQWYGLIHETWYSTPDQVTIMIICLLYAFFLTFFLTLKPVLVFNPEKLRERLP